MKNKGEMPEEGKVRGMGEVEKVDGKEVGKGGVGGFGGEKKGGKRK